MQVAQVGAAQHQVVVEVQGALREIGVDRIRNFGSLPLLFQDLPVQGGKGVGQGSYLHGNGLEFATGARGFIQGCSAPINLRKEALINVTGR